MDESRSKHEKTRNVGKKMIRKPAGQRPLGSSMRKWEQNITIDHRETGWESMDWINLAQGKD
jgi:hypothetical protein